MGWFRQTKQTGVTPDYTGLQLQTSVSTLPVPIIWGQTKASANVVWYANFQSHGGGGGGKGGLFGGASSSGYTYSADLIMALCEGPISGIGQIWRDQSTYTLASLGLSFFNGSTPQATWGYLAATYPAEALAYQGTAFVCAANYALGSNAEIGNHNFEIVGLLAKTGINSVDADPAQVIADFLTNPQYGAGFDPASIDATTLFGASGDSSLQTYCRALGIAFSPALTDQEQGSSILARWLQIVNCAAVWSGGLLKLIPYGDAAIPATSRASTTIPTIVPTPIPAGSGTTPPPSIEVCSSAEFVSDGGVKYAFTGKSLTSVGSSTPSATETYGISPAGTYLFATGDEGQAIEIAYAYTTGASFAPNLTPVYDLADSDFVDERGNKDPLQVSRVDPFSLPTIQRIECLSRDNEYATIPVEARDQSQIELYGMRVGSTIQAHEICDEINVGPIVAQTILQRQLYVRAHYAFKLSWEYCLLDPMDVVTINDANLGLSACPVRIVSIEEDDKGLLAVTAEELTIGVSTPALYANATTSSAVPNRSVTPDSVNTPLIYEPPAALTGGAAQIWVGASGGANGLADPNWGGANVWLSLDDVSYSQITTIARPLRQGQLTTALPAASGWDSTDTLNVNLAESGAALSGATAAAAQQGATRSLVDGEILAYESATLTGVSAYALTGLQRGLYGGVGAAHAVGASFARLDQAVVAYDLPSNFIGRTLYFKFQSFNLFGGGVEDLSTCEAYPFTPLGVGVGAPIAAQLAGGVPLDLGAVNAAPALADDFGALVGAVSGALDLGLA
jgi:hypothetical protein